MATRTDGNDAAFAARLRDFRDDLSAIENGEKYTMHDLLTDLDDDLTAMETAAANVNVGIYCI